MIKRKPFPLFLALALATASCHIRSASERAAASIVEKNAAARGGLDAWRAVQTLSMSGKMEAGKRQDPVKLSLAYMRSSKEIEAEAHRALARGLAPAADDRVQLPFVMELARPRRSRVEIRFQGQTAVQVFDGKQGWKLRPFLGRHEVEPFTADELHIAAQQTELDGPLIDAEKKGGRVELEGTEKVEGREAYRLKVTLHGGEVRRVWVDTQTLLEVKVDGLRRMDGRLRTVWTSLRDYRPVKGLMIPHLLETTVEGVSGSEKIVVEQVTLNPPLADGRFARPD